MWAEVGAKTNLDGMSDDKLNSAFLCLNKEGSKKKSFDVGYIRLDEPNFPELWAALVAKGKRKVDALNIDPNLTNDTNKCANCESLAASNDFLCESCRKNEQ